MSSFVFPTGFLLIQRQCCAVLSATALNGLGWVSVSPGRQAAAASTHTPARHPVQESCYSKPLIVVSGLL